MSLKNMLIFIKKDFFIGILIFFVPYTSFITPNNLKQLSKFDIYIILTSIFIILFTIIITSFVLNKLLRFFSIYSFSFFLPLCFGFYILFYFEVFRDFYINTTNSINKASVISIIFLFFIWSLVFAFYIRYKNFKIFFRNTITIFSLSIIVISITQNIFFYKNFLKVNKNIIGYENPIINYSKINFKELNIAAEEKNIYFIIIDGMISLELAKNINIINQKKIDDYLNLINNYGYKYIENSISSYNTTYLTFSSIFHMDHPVTENSEKYFDRSIFYPGMFSKKNPIMLTDFISKTNREFYFLGSYTNGQRIMCNEIVSESILCLDDNDIARILQRLSKTVYYNTPLSFLLKFSVFASSEYGDGQKNLQNYIKFSKNIKNDSNARFVFVHHFSPHYPYLKTKECNKYEFNQNFEGYSESYNCVMKEVLDFIDFINLNDPKALVVFQSDHGLNDVELMKEIKINDKKKLYSSHIFNLIKAPEACFNKFGSPKTNINTIRFIINCAYNLDIKYEKNLHYEGFYEGHELYGTVIPNHF